MPRIEFDVIANFSTKLATTAYSNRVRAPLANTFVEHVDDLWPRGESGRDTGMDRRARRRGPRNGQATMPRGGMPSGGAPVPRQTLGCQVPATPCFTIASPTSCQHQRPPATTAEPPRVIATNRHRVRGVQAPGAVASRRLRVNFSGDTRSLLNRPLRDRPADRATCPYGSFPSAPRPMRSRTRGRGGPCGGPPLRCRMIIK
jgi:hypothetical protein